MHALRKNSEMKKVKNKPNNKEVIRRKLLYGNSLYKNLQHLKLLSCLVIHGIELLGNTKKQQLSDLE